MSTKRRQRKSTGSADPQNDTGFYQALLDNPETRALVFQLLSQEKDAVAEYQRNEAKKRALASNASPLNRVKQNAFLESPTSMMRRRALEKMRIQENQSSSSETTGDSSNESSKSRNSSTPSIPYESLLKGVIAYVEIRSRDMDRSTGAKALMMTMGATVRESFTRDVTHVVFKDGSFTTYQKAKLLKVHLVSILWLEAVRKNHSRVPEKNFPAIGPHSYDRNVSNICSQLQKEYEEVVREDARRSLIMERPSSVRSTFTNRRRTIMTPFQSFRLEDPPLEALVTSPMDAGVERQPKRTFDSNLRSLSRRLSHVVESPSPPELTSDESNCGVIDGESSQSCLRNFVISETPENMIVNEIPSSSKNYSNFDNVTKMDVTNMALTMIENNVISNNDRVEYSGDSKSLIGGVRSSVRKSNFIVNSSESPRNVINSSLKGYDEKQALFTTPKSSRISSDKSTNVSSDVSSRKLSTGMYTSINSSVSSLELPMKGKSLEDKENVEKKVTPNKRSNKSKVVVSSNILLGATSTSTSTSTRKSKGRGKGKRESSGSSMSSLSFSGSKDNLNSVNSTLSNLQISCTNTGTNQKNNYENADTSKASSMSSLRISTEPKDTSQAPSTNMEICPDVESDKNLANESAFTDKSSNTNSSNKEGIEEALEILEKDISLSHNDPKKRKSFELESDVTTASNDYNDTSPPNIKDAFVTRRSKRLKHKTGSANKNEGKLIQIPSVDNLNQNSSPADSKTNSFKKNDDTVTLETASESSQETQPDISGVKQKKRRKLFNPNDSIQMNAVCNEEEERIKKRKEAEDKIQKLLEPVSNSTSLVPIPLTVRAKNLLSKLTEISPESASLNIEKSKTDKKKKKKPKNEKPVKHDSSADEQKLLAQEVFDQLKKDKKGEKPDESTTERAQTGNKDDESNFKTPRTRKSMRLSQHPRIKYTKSQGYVRPAPPVVPTPNRRSTLDFQVKTPVITSTKKKQKLKVVPSIVCTKLHKEDCQVFMQIVKKLGGFVLEDEVSERTTHLVVGDSKRTINMLRAIARGCWVIRYEWVLKSLEAGKWLPEEDYEDTEFSPVVQQCRLQRQAFGPTYSMDIFADCGPIYVAPHTIPRCSDLQELVRLCKGTVVSGIRGAKIVVGMFVQGDPACVSEKWVLDCISENRCKQMGRYRIKS